ncbi:hypothetical protein AAII07_50010 [Microvirga sp. 0TCS3.31]
MIGVRQSEDIEKVKIISSWLCRQRPHWFATKEMLTGMLHQINAEAQAFITRRSMDRHSPAGAASKFAGQPVTSQLPSARFEAEARARFKT